MNSEPNLFFILDKLSLSRQLGSIKLTQKLLKATSRHSRLYVCLVDGDIDIYDDTDDNISWNIFTIKSDFLGNLSDKEIKIFLVTNF